MELCIFARFHARPGNEEAVSQAMLEGMIPTREAFERHAELPHTVRFLEVVEPLIDNAFDIYRTEQIR